MSDDLPQPMPVAGDRGDFFEDVDAHLIEVTRHDQDDIVVGRQQIVLFLEDASENRLLSSTMTETL